MNRNLKVKALAKLALLPPFWGVLLFISAGTLNYWEGWLFLIVLSIAATLNTLNLIKNDPALLERRMNAGPSAESLTSQRIIMLCISILFIALLIVSGLDYRLSWSHLPMVAVFVGDLMIALSFVIFDLVFRENTFAAATVQIAKGQTVISTGPYRLIRHPMYLGGLLFLLGIPLALRSLWSVLIFVPLMLVFNWRIVDEERFLNLAGYTEYCAQVKYRLIPGLY